MPVVTGYEDTPGGHDALVLGVQLARLTGLAPIVATVHPAGDRGLIAISKDPRWREKSAEVATRRFATALTVIGTGDWGPDGPEFAVIGPGDVASALSDYADEVGAAVLVVGSTGHGLLGRLAPGRTVSRLLPTATCPVAIAPLGYRHTATSGISVVTVAYDGSPEADRAAAMATHLAGRTGAVLRYVAVAADGESVTAARELADKALATTPTGIDALADVVVGPVAATLAALPERTDLLVIGSRGYPLMRRLLLGGVAGALVRTARCPVIVVPGSEPA